MKILFLQLPQIDNDVSGEHENVPLAADYLEYALRRADPRGGYEFIRLEPAVAHAGDRILVDYIAAQRPDVIACTLYLWNVERTVNIVREVRSRLGAVSIFGGGPEVAFDHPFLTRMGGVRTFDALVAGEGETVFPALIAAARGGVRPDYSCVAWRVGRKFVYGKKVAPPVVLRRDLPPVDEQYAVPDVNGAGYIETTRGCPMRCTFCRYHHLRRGVSVLPVGDVISRIRQLIRRGAREIRFIDPTFNSHPEWGLIVDRLARLNRGGEVRFFAELKGDALKPEQIRKLAAANFSEIEVGMQSIDSSVLKRIHRPTRIGVLRDNLQMLGDLGVSVTLDIMYGLPGQTVDDVYGAIEYVRRIPNIKIQCMQTLLLPGTEIRHDASEQGLRAISKPPYGVVCTDSMSRGMMKDIENMLADSGDLPSDCETVRFAGYVLKDLFPDMTVVPRGVDADYVVPAGTDRRALMFEGDSFYARRGELVSVIRRAVRLEPDIHWQFVICPEREEPLDLFDLLISEIRRMPDLVADRYASARLSGRIASRRVFVKLRRGRAYDPDWVLAVEKSLRAAFF